MNKRFTVQTDLDGGGALLWGALAGVRPPCPPGPTSETLPGLLLGLGLTVQRLVHLNTSHSLIYTGL